MLAIQSNVALNSGSNVAAARTQATGDIRTPEVALEEAQANLANGNFTAQMQRDMENDLFTPQQLFGPNTMYHVQFNVAVVGTHHHIIYIPESGPAQIIVGGPHPSGQLVVEVGDLNNSGYRPLPGGASQQVSNIPISDPSAAWPTMVETATQINQSGLYYHG